MSLSFCSEVPQFSPTHTFHNNSFYLLLCWLIPWDQRACQQSIVETELFPFNSRSVHVLHERNVGHFLASWNECEWNLPSSFLTKWMWTECNFMFLFWHLQHSLGNFLKKRSKIFFINVFWARFELLFG